MCIFCVQLVYDFGILARNDLSKSYVYNYGNDRSVSPVVSISTNFSLTGSGEEFWGVYAICGIYHKLRVKTN